MPTPRRRVLAALARALVGAAAVAFVVHHLSWREVWEALRRARIELLVIVVAIGVWRHIVHRFPLRYHPSYWAMVFPLGMYGVATYRMRVAIDLDALAFIPPLTFAIALAACAAAAAGMVESWLPSRVRRAAPPN